MLKSLRIKNFKCFRDQKFAMKRLSVFCGQNGVGKSTAIQTLLLMREAFRKRVVAANVPLNGWSGLELGQIVDVFHNDPCSEAIELAYSGWNTSRCITAKANSEVAEDHFLCFKSAWIAPECFCRNETGLFTYLSAERNGPRDLQEIKSVAKDELQIGVRGEYVAEVLHANERNTIRKELLHPDTDFDKSVNRQLRHQVERWLSELFPKVEINVITMPGTNAIGIRVKRSGLRSDWMKPTNFGFGISYSLPIIVGGLLGKIGGMLLVDSPEAHLHPRAQSKMAHFLSAVAASGTQVIIETHSDHILNGVRLSATMGNRIPPEEVVIHFLAEIDGSVIAEEIGVTRLGSLTSWPKGFFDQSEKDLAEIVKKKRNAR